MVGCCYRVERRPALLQTCAAAPQESGSGFLVQFREVVITHTPCVVLDCCWTHSCTGRRSRFSTCTHVVLGREFSATLLVLCSMYPYG